MKMVVPITIDDANMTTDAVAESYDEWGTDYSISTLTSAARGPIREIAINQLTGDIWYQDYNRLYKYVPSANTTALVRTSDTATGFCDLKINPYTNRVYVVDFISSGSLFYLIEIDPETFSETVLADLTSYGTSFRLAIDLSTSNIYFIRSGLQYVYKYTDSTGAISTHATLGFNADKIAYDSTNSDIYIVQSTTADVYVQRGTTGTFDALITTGLGISDITVNELDNSLIGRLSEVIYTADYGETEWTELVDTGGGFLYSIAHDWGSASYLFGDNTVALKTYSSKHFSLDDYVIYNDRIYVSLGDSYNVRPGTDDSVWFNYGATNPYRMFDGAISTPTTATGSINLTLENDNITAIGFFGMTAQAIQVVLTVDAVEVYDETIELRSTEVGDWYEYFFNPINQVKDTVFEDIPAYSSGEFTITISGASVADAVEAGLMVPGYSYDVGTTKRGVKPGFVNYSTTEVDDFGRISIVSRGSAKTLDCECFLDSRAQASTVIDLYNRTKDLKCLWIGSRDADTWSLIYGVCKRFDATIEDNNGKYSLQILGVV